MYYSTNRFFTNVRTKIYPIKHRAQKNRTERTFIISKVKNDI